MITVTVKGENFATTIGKFKPRDIIPLVDIFYDCGIFDENGNLYEVNKTSFKTEMRGGVRITVFVIEMTLVQ